jgi:hypothetical protein
MVRLPKAVESLVSAFSVASLVQLSGVSSCCFWAGSSRCDIARSPACCGLWIPWPRDAGPTYTAYSFVTSGPTGLWAKCWQRRPREVMKTASWCETRHFTRVSN